MLNALSQISLAFENERRLQKKKKKKKGRRLTQVDAEKGGEKHLVGRLFYASSQNYLLRI
jgi:hypothetical protein